MLYFVFLRWHGQGQDAALTVITNEAFQKLKKGNGSITDAAAMQVKLTYFTEQLEDSTSMVCVTLGWRVYNCLDYLF